MNMKGETKNSVRAVARNFLIVGLCHNSSNESIITASGLSTSHRPSTSHGCPSDHSGRVSLGTHLVVAQKTRIPAQYRVEKINMTAAVNITI